MEGNNAEIDGSGKIDRGVESGGVPGQSNTFGDIIPIRKCDDQDEITRNRPEDEAKQFAGFKREVHRMDELSFKDRELEGNF